MAKKVPMTKMYVYWSNILTCVNQKREGVFVLGAGWARGEGWTLRKGSSWERERYQPLCVLERQTTATPPFPHLSSSAHRRS